MIISARDAYSAQRETLAAARAAYEAWSPLSDDAKRSAYEAANDANKTAVRRYQAAELLSDYFAPVARPSATFIEDGLDRIPDGEMPLDWRI